MSLCATAWGQTKPVELLYLDVTASGAAAPLTDKDVELFADGKPLKIAGVTRVDQHLNRTLVLVVDDLGLSLEGIRNVQRGLRRLVADQVQPGDRVAIVRTGSQSAPRLGFTSDRPLLNAAVDRIEYHPLQDAAGARPKAFTSGTLLALRFVMDALTKSPGRKAVVFFSERTNLHPRADAGTRAEAESLSTRIAALAGQGMALLYCIPVSGSAVQAGPGPAARLDTGLVAAVKETGGSWIDGSADFSAALSRVLQEQAEYYKVAFRPDAHAYDYVSGRDRMDKITVKATREGVLLRARSVVYGASDESGIAPFPPDVGDDDQESSSTPGFEGVAIGLDSSHTFFYSATEGAYLELVLHIDTRRLTYVRTLMGEYKCVLQVGSIAVDASGQPAGQSSRGVAYSLTEAQYQNVLANGVVYTQKLPLRKGGAYRVHSEVRDVATGRTGFAARYLEIPDVQSGDLAMSGIVNQPGSPPERIFKPGATFSYSYQLYNLLANGDKRSEAEIQSRLFRSGNEVFAGKPTRVAFDRNTSPNITVVNGTISLGTDMTPGRYIMQVTATDKLADKPRTATQFIDLEVRP